MRRLNHATPSSWAWAAAGVLAGALSALLVFAPARWLAAAVQQISKGRLVLAEPQGSVWKGSAQLVLTGGAGSSEVMALPGRIAWKISSIPMAIYDGYQRIFRGLGY